MRGRNHGARRSLRRAMDVEGRGLGEERLHAEDRGTGRRDWCSVRPREKEERERARRGTKHERHSVCTSGPRTKRSRCHQTWEGQKISWIRGERKTHTGRWRRQQQQQHGGGSEGGYSLQGRQREAAEEGLRGERWGWGGDRPAWELGESPSSGATRGSLS